MPSQVLSEQSSCVEAFASLLRAHAAVTRRLSAQLTADHGLTISDFEVLLRLARAPDRRMRRVDLAQQVVLTASGVTRLLDGLERSGYVERDSCASDRRVVYAVLTDAGLVKVAEASASHFELSAGPGNNRPNTMPRAIAMITQNHSCLTSFLSRRAR